jgi:nitroreductase
MVVRGMLAAYSAGQPVRGGAMDTFEAICKRHSYRGGFTSEPVPREDLRKIVDAGIRAPSGKNAQTTTFVIVDDPDLVKEIGGLHARNAAMQQARAFIACIVDRAPDPVFEEHDFVVEDCAAAVENMLLAVTALGFATVWIDGWLRLDGHAETIGKLLGVPADKIIRVLLPLGKPTTPGEQKEKLPFERRAWFNRYGRLGD